MDHSMQDSVYFFGSSLFIFFSLCSVWIQLFPRETARDGVGLWGFLFPLMVWGNPLKHKNCTWCFLLPEQFWAVHLFCLWHFCDLCARWCSFFSSLISFLFGMNKHFVDNLNPLIDRCLSKSSGNHSWCFTAQICIYFITKWSSSLLFRQESAISTPQSLALRSLQLIPEPDCLCEKCWLKFLQLSRQRKKSQI